MSDYERNCHKSVVVLPFALGVKVKVKNTEIVAITSVVAIGYDGFEYKIRWWTSEGSRGETWVSVNELELLT